LIDEATIWRELGLALSQRGHTWQLPALATVAEDGSADARTVVLREVDATARQLVFFTQAGSAKVGQIALHPVGTLLFWSRALQWQLRAKVRLSALGEGDAAAARWARIAGTTAERDYLGADGGLGFAVVTAQALSFEVLVLSPDGAHRTTRFDFGDAGTRVSGV
jgi:pyridoxamine 5'-phosphate oxidase